MDKKVTESTWLERMNNLNERRKNETIKNSVPGVDDYAAHIRKGYIGHNVLDVGCGSQIIRSVLPSGIAYVGIDPFPQSSAPSTVQMQIEKCTFPNEQFDTVYCFAALDNVMDFEAALFQIKRVCKINVVFLTGINIPPDKYHTIEITEEALVAEMAPFQVSYRELLHPKILLIEFLKKK